MPEYEELNELKSDQGYNDSVTADIDNNAGYKSKGTNKGESFSSFLKELPLLIITAVAIAFVVKWLIIQPFYIPSPSMVPALVPGDRVLVSKFNYKLVSPKPGDIIVFIPPQIDDNRDFIKRVIAIENDTVKLVEGKVYINGKPAPQNYETMPGDFEDWGPLTVPEGHVFVMGDNRPNSYDGRRFGPVPEENIVGRAFMVYWPLNHIRILN